jgi:hypothetical protein
MTVLSCVAVPRKPRAAGGLADDVQDRAVGRQGACQRRDRLAQHPPAGIRSSPTVAGSSVASNSSVTGSIVSPAWSGAVRRPGGTAVARGSPLKMIASISAAMASIDPRPPVMRKLRYANIDLFGTAYLIANHRRRRASRVVRERLGDSVYVA